MLPSSTIALESILTSDAEDRLLTLQHATVLAETHSLTVKHETVRKKGKEGVLSETRCHKPRSNTTSTCKDKACQTYVRYTWWVGLWGMVTREAHDGFTTASTRCDGIQERLRFVAAICLRNMKHFHQYRIPAEETPGEASSTSTETAEESEGSACSTIQTLA